MIVEQSGFFCVSQGA